MKVFIGSTVFDLIDIRAEIADFLRSIDIVPVLSDDKLSDFAVQQDTNSIETCLVNVDACEEIIFVLDRRYGPRLGAYGFDDVSATHLEYRRAVKNRMPIHFYVRDRLEADYNIWKNNKKQPDLRLSWVSEKDRGLFDFLEERRRLDPDADNWITTFTNVVDLKASLQRYFDEAFLPERLANAIYRNEFPLMDVSVTSEVSSLNQPININVTATNGGKAAALNFELYFEDEARNQSKRHFLSAGQSVTCLIHGPASAFQGGVVKRVRLEYDTMLGVSVREQYKVTILVCPTPMGPQLFTGPELVSREYFRGKQPRFEIADK